MEFTVSLSADDEARMWTVEVQHLVTGTATAGTDYRWRRV